MEMERVNGKAALVLDLAKAFDSAFQWSWLGDAFQLSKEDLAGAVRLF